MPRTVAVGAQTKLKPRSHGENHADRTAEVEVFTRRDDGERFIEEVRGDDPKAADKLRIEEHELEAGGLN